MFKQFCFPVKNDGHRPEHFRFCLFVVACVWSLSCNHLKSKAGVEAAMKQYDHLIKNMDADSIALLYSPDGRLGEMARGRDSIRKFLSGFKNVSVLSQSSTTASIDMAGDSSIQIGTYRQVVVINGKDTMTVKGEFTAIWEWMPDNSWHIRQMTTKSTN